MNFVVSKLKNRYFIFKLSIVIFLTLYNLIMNSILIGIQSTNFSSYVFYYFSKQTSLYSVFFVSVFILTYNSINELYLNNEISLRHSRKRILINKFLEFTVKIMIYYFSIFALLFLYSLIEPNINFEAGWNTIILRNTEFSKLNFLFDPWVYTFLLIIKYYVGTMIVLMTGYLIYLKTKNPSSGIITIIGIIISMNAIGSNAFVLTIRENWLMNFISKLTINYHIGTTNILQFTQYSLFIKSELISLVYLVFVLLFVYVLCEILMDKFDIL